MTVPAKSLQPYNHTCRYKCNSSINEDMHQMIHNIGLTELQTSFICSSVTSIDPRRPKKNTNKHRKFSHMPSLNGYRACKEFFLRTLGISNTRYNRAIKMKASNHSFSPKDRRGKHALG